MTQSSNETRSSLRIINITIIISCISAFIISNYLIGTVVTPLLSKSSDTSAIKTTNEVISNIRQELNIAKTLAVSMASITSVFPKEESVLRHLLPNIISAKGIQKNILGGGIWPEPFITNSNKEKNSLFWGKNKQGELIFFDDYNKESSPAYHHEAWYSPVKKLETNQVIWSKSYIDPYTKQHMTTVSAPIWVDNSYYGVSTIDLNLDNIIKSIEKSARQLDGYGFLIDSDGRFIAPPNVNPQQNNTRNSALYLSILKQNTTTFILNKNSLTDNNISFFDVNTQPTEESSRVLLLHMPDTNWTVGFITQKKVFTTPVNHFLQKVAIYQAATLVIFLGIILFTIKKLIHQPFCHLISQLKGENKHLNHLGKGQEVELLTRLFNQRHDQLQQSKKELRESADILQRALDSAHAGTLHFNPASHTLEWDDRSRIIFGLTISDQENTDKFTLLEKIIHPDDRSKVTTKFKEALDDKSVTNYQVEYRIILPNKELRWVQGSVRISRDKEGNAISSNGLHFDLTERKLSEASIIEKEMAEESNRLKSEFLANMSHELRTPMHGILSFANFGIKKSETASREKLFQYFTYIQTSGERLLILLNDLLDLSKVEAGKLVLNKQKSDLNAIIQSFCNEQQQRLADSSITLKFNTASNDMVGNFDPTRIGQVICNLLSNAIKFSPANKSICIATHTNDLGQLTFSINNQGSPIPPSELESIFDPFIQSNKPPSDITGTGLGLAISREFIGAHGGKIWAEANETIGATFHFILPAN